MTNLIEAIEKTAKSVRHIRIADRRGNHTAEDLGFVITRATIQSEHLEVTSEALVQNANDLLSRLKKLQDKKP